MEHRKFARQSGFTLVEIAIVLVIIGLLLGGVLKGQELIENNRITFLAANLRTKAIASLYLTKVFSRLPGDEAAATMNARGWLGTAGAGVAGNGALAITVGQTFTNGGDQAAFWRGLRGSGLISGDPNAPATVAGLPSHGGGGVLGVTAGPAYGSPGPLVCASGLTTKQAAGVDGLIDGAGAANSTGSLLGAQGAANPLPVVAAVPALTPYDETTANRWTVCMRL